MRVLSVFRALHSKTRPPSQPFISRISRAFSNLQLQNGRPSFGIAFDIDGVILRGREPVGGSQFTLKRLYDDCGGGIPESKRAYELGDLLGVNLLPLQIVQGHSPFKELVNRFRDKFIVAVGKGEPAAVMTEYGFKRVVSTDEYESYFNGIDPLSQYKTWGSKQIFSDKYYVRTDKVQAVFVVSDPVDWGRDIQVVCDILRSGGLPGKKNGHQPPLFFAADDLEYQCKICRIHHDSLKYTSFGKPNPAAFKNAETILKQIQSICYPDTESNQLKTIYMIGDNPAVDIKGARQAGHPWFSILTRTGVFKGRENDFNYPADLVGPSVPSLLISLGGPNITFDELIYNHPLLIYIAPTRDLTEQPRSERKMRFLSVFKALQSKSSRSPSQSHPFISKISRAFSNLQPKNESPSFGIAFDIDGVILRGHEPVGGSQLALKRLYDDRGGGIRESKRAYELGELLRVKLLPLQIVQGHSPFKELVHRFGDKFIVAVGKGEPDAVMTEYGFKEVVSMDEYESYFNDIDPLSQYKTWRSKQIFSNKFYARTDKVQAVFIVSDPVDWGRDIQILCDILRSGGLPGTKNGHQPPLFFANDDLEYQGVFPTERLGMGAFRIALESVFNKIHCDSLKYTSFGKPNPVVFKNAEAILKQIQSMYYPDAEGNQLKTIYMIGDNPTVDINGARQAGPPWFSILTRTGVFKGKENDFNYPADLVVDTVEEAVDFILEKGASVSSMICFWVHYSASYVMESSFVYHNEGKKNK
ncbi:HAD-superfamily hydrolase [Cinnamomum micranthum f. kanehirae]|uniref:HAD-superfamily hydrolase n=1 Tax=Cinnamomum micranthum f. kanehirae TaxID=337451 RepID=A0A443P547_9MAGN|nr:HAD-superfamily hydrolase [Cinnamomum micranthum f. kanehirae]